MSRTRKRWRERLRISRWRRRLRKKKWRSNGGDGGGGSLGRGRGGGRGGGRAEGGNGSGEEIADFRLSVLPNLLKFTILGKTDI